jgi:hypothetical protein
MLTAITFTIMLLLFSITNMLAKTFYFPYVGIVRRVKEKPPSVVPAFDFNSCENLSPRELKLIAYLDDCRESNRIVMKENIELKQLLFDKAA